MSKPVWRVMVTLEHETVASKEQLERFVKDQLEDASCGAIEVTRVEAVEVTK